MADFFSLPLATDAYLADTIQLTTLQHGAYLLLLITAWRTQECALPDDDRLLAKYSRLTTQKWKKVRPELEPFFTIENGVWKQKRLTKERNRVNQKRISQSNNAKLRWQDKSLKNNDVAYANGSSSHIPTECQPDASISISRSKPTDTPCKSPRGTKRKTQIPDGFPFQEDLDRATEYWLEHHRPDLNPEQEAEAFRDHHTSRGTTLKDWSAGFRTWRRNAMKYTKPEKQLTEYEKLEGKW